MKQFVFQNQKPQNTCVAFGRFDGLHKGHFEIVKALAEQKKKGLCTVLISFDENKTSAGILTTEEEKSYILQNSGVDYFFSYKGDGETLDSPLDIDCFFEEVLQKQLGVQKVILGKNSEYLEFLLEKEKTFEFELLKCEILENEGVPLSSQQIKTALASADMVKVNQLVGRDYLILGEVVVGKKLGRTIGMPTANISVAANKLLPPSGVYSTTAYVDKIAKKGLVSIGRRPTVDSFEYVTIENYILDFSGDLYGKKLPLEISGFLREIVKFDSLQELKQQVDRDVAHLKNL